MSTVYLPHGGLLEIPRGKGLKGQTLLKFPEKWKVSNQISLGVEGVWTFSGTTQ